VIPRRAPKLLNSGRSTPCSIRYLPAGLSAGSRLQGDMVGRHRVPDVDEDARSFDVGDWFGLRAEVFEYKYWRTDSVYTISTDRHEVDFHPRREDGPD